MPRMPALTSWIAAGALCALAALAAAPVAAQDNPAPAVVPDYTLFVDPPTAFAFIKLPTGWKFVGKLDVTQLRQLPPGTVTSLLQREEDAVRMADAPAPSHRR